MTNSNGNIGAENKQTKEYIFFSGTKVRILNEYYNFLCISVLFVIKKSENKEFLQSLVAL